MEQTSFLVREPAPKRGVRSLARDTAGRFKGGSGPPPASAEVATVQKAEFLFPPFSFDGIQYPNLSAIIRTRSNGLGIGFYDTMEGTDADLASFFRDLVDDVLHYPYTIQPAGPGAAYAEHAKLFKFALDSIPNRQNVIRHFLTAYARGFSVTERMYRVVDRGDWRGAVIYDALLDKPQRWFAFDMKRNLLLKTFENYYPGLPVDPNKFIVLSFGTNSNPWGEALFDLCYWPWYLKHHALKNQAVFMEKWASPTAKAEYEWSPNGEKLNQENRDKAIEVLQSIQNDSSIAVPKGMLVTLLESARNGTVSFESYINQLTEMESRVVTGQLLTSMGTDGGSHALGKVHEKRAANKVEMLADFVSHAISRYIGRDLVDRNYGPQDAYPTLKILAKSPVSRQADAELEKLLIENGHEMSRSWSDEAFGVVPPIDANDKLVFPTGLQPDQTVPVPASLAAPVKFAAPPEVKQLHAEAKVSAKATLAQHKAVGASAVKKAKPAIKKVTASLADTLRTKKKANDATKATVAAGLKTAQGVGDLGSALDNMLHPDSIAVADPVGVDLADDSEPTPPAISDDAKLALALQVLAIADRIAEAAKDAPAETTGDAAADSMTDPQGVSVDSVFGNLFEGTHSTNIASISTGQLRKNLASPAFRKNFPYCMIVVTNPNARLSHQMMDGYVLTSEEAQYSSFLPPFDYGCDCKVVPISVARAKAAGLTGAEPTGSMDSFLRGKGAQPNSFGPGYRTPAGETFTPGTAPGFAPAFAGTDRRVQLEALRQKAADLAQDDPQAWASTKLWLAWLFGYDVLSQDPQPEEETNP